MPETAPLTPLLSAIRDLVSWLEHERVDGVLIGGVASSLLGRPRVTRDVDALIMLDQERWAGFLESAKTFGFSSRLTDALDFAQRARVLLLRHDSSGIDVDVSLGMLPFEAEAIERATWFDVGGSRIPLPDAEDLIVMKAVAHRPRDLADIESILACNPDIDAGRIRRWVRQFADALESPEILDDLDALLDTAIKRG